MEQFRIGKDGKIDVLGFGTYRIGETIGLSSDESNIKALKKAFELGYRLIDTAEEYAAGHTEELIGKALRYVERDNFFITSKVWTNHLHYGDVIKACEGSLRRLQVKCIDLYLIHWPNSQVPIKETVSALEKLVDDGKIKYIGVSNFSAEELKEAMECTSKHQIVANQVRYSLLDKEPEVDLLPFAKENNVRIIAYTPLERGHIRIPMLRELSSKYVKTENQIALNYLICKGSVPIPKAVHEEHMIENLGAVGWRLSDEDVEKLSSLK
ncbi:MAG: aldo/keto reductase [Nitrososphaeria archaeon]|jgi:diketogulonate reductase-like aldo/keto reductase